MIVYCKRLMTFAENVSLFLDWMQMQIRRKWTYCLCLSQLQFPNKRTIIIFSHFYLILDIDPPVTHTHLCYIYIFYRVYGTCSLSPVPNGTYLRDDFSVFLGCATIYPISSEQDIRIVSKIQNKCVRLIFLLIKIC